MLRAHVAGKVANTGTNALSALVTMQFQHALGTNQGNILESKMEVVLNLPLAKDPNQVNLRALRG